VTAILGAVIYPDYRLEVRVVIEQLGLRPQNGMFELKEHFAVIGLAMLPAYWYYWRQPLAAEHARTRAVLTGLLAFIEKLDGYWTVTAMTMADALEGTRTELIVDKAEYGVGLRPDDFSRVQLERGVR
jgi:hypothetical protein